MARRLRARRRPERSGGQAGPRARARRRPERSGGQAGPRACRRAILVGVQVRPGAIPPDGFGPKPAGDSLSWRVAPGPLRFKVAGAVFFAVLAVIGSGDPVRLAIAAVAAVILAAYAVRDVVAPVRLSADPSGI